MPTTLVGLFIFVVFLAPGLVFTTRRTARQPVQKVSPFRETAVVVLYSALCNTLALSIFIGLRAWQPRHTPDVGFLVRHTSQYVTAEYVYLGAWLVLMLGLACLLAIAVAAASSSRVATTILGWQPLRWLRPSADAVT